MNEGSHNASANDLAPLAREQFVVAIDFGGTKIAVATADMTGSILKQARLDTNASQGAQQLLERTTVTARALIEGTMAEAGGQCVAVGVATPGIVHDNGVLLVIPIWFATISKRELFDIDLKAQSLFAVFSRVLVGGEITLHEQH